MTPDLEAARAAVAAAIDAAFDGVERGNGVTLHEATALDYCGSEKTLRKARRLDAETRWQDVTDAAIEANPSALSFLDAEGFRYYIPAFLLYALPRCYTSGEVSADAPLYTFQNDVDSDKRFRLLNDAQRRAICQFIRYCDLAERDMEAKGYPVWGSAEVTLRFGWERYCGAAGR